MASTQEPNIAIGIDLGTTFSCVSVYHDGKLKIISNPEGNKKTPSQVAFTDVGRLVGDPAKNQAAINPEKTFFNVKRLIGRRFDDQNIQLDSRILPFEIVNEEPNIALQVNFKNKQMQLPPEQVSSMILQKMKNTAERQLGCEIKNAVITVPANFNDGQRQATKDAAEIAGLKVLQLINEPTAAALAYVYERGLNKDQKLLFFDFGGGTLDVSIVTIKIDSYQNVSLEVNGTAGDSHFGGTDFDEKLLEYFSKEFNEENSGVDITKNARSMKRLLLVCENAKKVLSTNTEAPIDIDSLFEGKPLVSQLSQDEFEKLCDDLFGRILSLIKEVLKEAKTKKEEIKDIVLVGGSTRIPKVRQILQDFFKRKVLNNYINPDEAVAYGAAVQAAILSGIQLDSLRRLTLQDVTPWDYLQGNPLHELIGKGSQLTSTKQLTIHGEDAQSMEMRIIGKKEQTGNFEIGKIKIKNSQPDRKLEFTFEVNKDGILTVSAVDKETKAEELVVFDKGRISPSDRLRMVEETKTYEREEKLHLEKLEAKNKLEEYAKEIGDVIRHNRREHFEENFDYLQNVMNEEMKWLENDTAETAEVYNLRCEKLKNVCDPIIKRLDVVVKEFERQEAMKKFDDFLGRMESFTKKRKTINFKDYELLTEAVKFGNRFQSKNEKGSKEDFERVYQQQKKDYGVTLRRLEKTREEFEIAKRKLTEFIEEIENDIQTKTPHWHNSEIENIRAILKNERELLQTGETTTKEELESRYREIEKTLLETEERNQAKRKLERLLEEIAKSVQFNDRNLSSSGVEDLKKAVDIEMDWLNHNDMASKAVLERKYQAVKEHAESIATENNQARCDFEKYLRKVESEIRNNNTMSGTVENSKIRDALEENMSWIKTTKIATTEEFELKYAVFKKLYEAMSTQLQRKIRLGDSLKQVKILVSKTGNKSDVKILSDELRWLENCEELTAEKEESFKSRVDSIKKSYESAEEQLRKNHTRDEKKQQNRNKYDSMPEGEPMEFDTQEDIGKKEAKLKLETYIIMINDWTLENTPKLSEAEFKIMTTAMKNSEGWIADAEQDAIESYYRKIKSECDKIMEKHNRME